MELVTMFCPLTTTGAGELVTQAAVGAKFVVDCNVKPVALVGHVKNTLAPEQMRVNCGANTPTVNTSNAPMSTMPPAIRGLPSKSSAPAIQVSFVPAFRQGEFVCK